MVVKPVCGMCSCGVHRADSFAELRHAVAALQRRYHDDVLVERFVPGMDVTLGVIEAGGVPRCLPPLQRFFGGRDDPAFAHFALPHPSAQLREGAPVPAELTGAQRSAASAMAVAAFRVLGLRHFARCDFRIAGSKVWLLEANHKSDLTRAGLFARSARLTGIEYAELIRGILATARRSRVVRDAGEPPRARRRTRLPLS